MFVFGGGDNGVNVFTLEEFFLKSSNSTDPKRDHGGEVEGGDARRYSEWQAVRQGVHVLGDALQRLP